MWLRLVQSARDKEEQNLEAYIKNGQLFYRSLRRIAKDEELLVWYGKELTELLLLYPSRSHKMNGRLACDLRVGRSLAGGGVGRGWGRREKRSARNSWDKPRLLGRTLLLLRTSKDRGSF